MKCDEFPAAGARYRMIKTNISAISKELYDWFWLFTLCFLQVIFLLGFLLVPIF